MKGLSAWALARARSPAGLRSSRLLRLLHGRLPAGLLLVGSCSWVGARGARFALQPGTYGASILPPTTVCGQVSPLGPGSVFEAKP